MLGVDSSFSEAYRQAISALPLPTSSDAVVFGANARNDPFILLTLSDDQRFAIERAKKYALEQSIQNALNKQNVHMQQQDLNTIKRNQALILLSRIYVGSISFEIGEDEIRKTFSSFGPIKSVALSWDSVLQKHKGFAFVEFDVPEAASLALDQMTGFTLAGRTLKVGRPSNAPQTVLLEAELRADESTKNRIFVASVHTELTEGDLQTVFEAFGKVSNCTLYPDPKIPGRHRGFGYIEFESEESAIAAVSSMNCFDLAGQQLRVGRAITPKGMPLPFETTLKTPTLTTVTSNQVPASQVALAAASISAKVMSIATEQTDVLTNGTNGTSHSKSNSGATGFSEPTVDVAAALPPPGIFIPTSIGNDHSADSLPLEEQSESIESASLGESVDVIAPPAASVWDDDDVESSAPIPTTESHSSPPEDTIQGEEVALPNMPSDDTPSSFENLLFVAPPSRVLLLENMVGVEEVDDDLNAEVTEECSLYGDVLRVVIHTSQKQTPDIRIFVQFDRSDSAQLACEALNSRFFAGRIVRARLYDEELFQLRELDEE